MSLRPFVGLLRDPVTGDPVAWADRIHTAIGHGNAAPSGIVDLEIAEEAHRAALMVGAHGMVPMINERDEYVLVRMTREEMLAKIHHFSVRMLKDAGVEVPPGARSLLLAIQALIEERDEYALALADDDTCEDCDEPATEPKLCRHCAWHRSGAGDI